MTDTAPNNDVTELRRHLFDTMRALSDKSNPMDIERAKAVADVAQTIINSAKVEVEHLKISGGQGSGFIPQSPTVSGLPSGTKVIDQKPGVTVTRHALKG